MNNLLFSKQSVGSSLASHPPASQWAFRRAYQWVWSIAAVDRFLFLLCCVSCLLGGSIAWGEEPLRREIYVPAGELPLLLNQTTQRVFLSREEYENLYRKAEQLEREKPPQDIGVVASRYVINIQQGRVLVDGSLTLDVLSEGIHELPLSLGGVSILSMKHLEEKTSAELALDQGKPVLILRKPGRHTFELALSAPLQASAATQALRLQLHTVASTTLELNVPGNVELRSGSAVLQRTVDEQSNATRFQLLPTREPLDLVLSMNNRQRRTDRVVSAKSVQVSEVSESFERLFANTSFAILHGVTDEFRFAIPAGFEISEVRNPLLAAWSVEEEEDKRTLVVKLRESTSDTQVVEMIAQRSKVPFDAWVQGQIKPLGVESDVAILGLILAESLRIESSESENLIAVDQHVLLQGLPVELQGIGRGDLISRQPGANETRLAPQSSGQPLPETPATFRPVAAFYAPYPSYELRGVFRRPAQTLRATSNYVLNVQKQGLELHGGFSLIPEAESIMEIDFRVPEGWHVHEVRLASGQILDPERYPEGMGTRLHVRLPEGIRPSNTVSILFQATHTPPNWLNAWDEIEVAFPRIEILDVDHEVGAVAVQKSAEFSTLPAATEGLTVLGEREKAAFLLAELPTALAYRFDAAEWSLQLKVQRHSARLTARCFSFFRIEQDVVPTHYEIVYDAERVGTTDLHFSLPDSTPAEISIRGLDSTQVKESISRVADERRHWHVSLVEPQVGRVRLAVDLQIPWPDAEPKSFAMPLVRAEEVEYQWGMVSIEGHPELDVSITDHPRPIDIGAMTDADYQIGTRLLGAFSYIGEAARIEVSIARRPGYSLPSTLVERAELVSVLSTQGITQTVARLRLATKAYAFEVQLPDGAKLWSMYLGDQALLPQRDGGRLVINLPTNTSVLTQDLRIVYETPSQPAGIRRAIEIQGPTLLVRQYSEAAAQEVPLADVQWLVYLPTGYRMTSAEGTVFTDALDTSKSFLQSLGESLYLVGGGRMLPRLQYARVAADRSAPNARTEGYALGLQEQIDAPNASVASPAPGAAMDQDDLFGVPPRELAKSSPASPNEPSMGAAAPAALPQGEVSEIGRESKERSQREMSVVPGAQRGKARELWALEGMRSLDIQLASLPDTPAIEFQSLGAAPQMRMTIIQSQSWRWGGYAAAAFAFLGGMFLLCKSIATQIKYVIGLIVFAAVFPLLLDWQIEFQGISQGLIATAGILGLLFLAVAAVRRCCACCTCCKPMSVEGPILKPESQMPPSLLVLLAVIALSQGSATQVNAQDKLEGVEVQSAEALQVLLGKEFPKKPLAIPDDAVVIAREEGSEERDVPLERVLVPYEKYKELWNAAHPDKKKAEVPPRIKFSTSAVQYQMQVVESDSALLRGKLDLDLYDDSDHTIPLPFMGGVLETITMDGNPAKVSVLAADQREPQAAAQAALPPEADKPSELVVLHASGRGRKVVEFSVRVKVEQMTGWRSVNVYVPSAAAAKVEVQVPRADTELLFQGLHSDHPLVTNAPDQAVEIGLPLDGRFNLQWRDRAQPTVVDRGLTAESTILLDVQESSLHVVWQAALSFAQGQRDRLSLQVPSGYLVEQVLGPNVRGWQSLKKETGNEVQVTLLKAAIDRETVILRLSRPRLPNDAGTSSFDLPVLTVPEAVMQQGEIIVRRSKMLEVSQLDATGLSRIDIPEKLDPVVSAADLSLLPMRVFQAYRFIAPSYTARFEAKPVPRKVAVSIQSLLKLSPKRLSFENRFRFNVQGRPVHRVAIRVPAAAKLEKPQSSAVFEWAARTELDAQTVDQAVGQIVDIFFANGQMGEFQVVMTGELPVAAGEPAGEASEAPLPKFEVLQVDQQASEFVVQTDPAFQVTVADLVQCRTELLGRFSGWLDATQVAASRVGIVCPTAEYGATLRLVPRTGTIVGTTMTNVHVTDRIVEETILLDLSLRGAGAKQISFLLPQAFRDAKVEAPYLRQMTVTEAGGELSNLVRFQLELQEERLGEYRVLVQRDRLLTSGDQQTAIPIVENARIDRRYVALENASRDELLIAERKGVEPLGRQQVEWREVAELLGGNANHLFLVKESDPAPSLSFELKERAAVTTVGASIPLAQTMFVLDSAGTYRVSQEYRVENRTEQFLEIQLPDGAQLWTSYVAKEPVKPTVAPGKSAQHVRIPLVKTAEGELDYGVTLVYGGELSLSSRLARVQFPLIRTTNIRVELSQVRLWLPKNLAWLDFGGSLGRVEDEGDLAAEVMSYQTKQVGRLMQVLREGQVFSRARAATNLKQLGQALESQSESESLFKDNQQYRQQQADNSRVLEEANQEVTQQMQALQKESRLGNRAALGSRFLSQGGEHARQGVDKLGRNFAVTESVQPLEEKGRFDLNWFSSNALQSPEASSSMAGESGKKGDAGSRDAKSSDARNIWENKPAATKGAEQPAAPNVLNQSVDQLSSSMQRRGQNAPLGQNQTRDDLYDQANRYQLRLEQQQSAGQMANDPFQVADREGAAAGADAGMGMAGEGSPAASSHLASLAIEIPQRGEKFLFTTARGEVELSATGISRSLVDRGVSLGWILALGLVLWGIVRGTRRLLQGEMGRVLLGILLLGVFAISLLSGIMPLYGLAALVGAIYLLGGAVGRFRRRATA